MNMKIVDEMISYRRSQEKRDFRDQIIEFLRHKVRELEEEKEKIHHE